MSEFLGYGYFTEIPAVLVNVQRCGPSTGMPTRTQQADIMACAYASHGDTRHVLLFPANPEETFYLGARAFDLAERLQTPLIVLTDLDIGMNDWMCRDLKWDGAYQPDRGKVMTAEQLEKIEKFHRYLDVDGDGIPWRTLPGVHPKGAFFTRGSGHNMYGTYTEAPLRLPNKNEGEFCAAGLRKGESVVGGHLGVRVLIDGSEDSPVHAQVYFTSSQFRLCVSDSASVSDEFGETLPRTGPRR